MSQPFHYANKHQSIAYGGLGQCPEKNRPQQEKTNNASCRCSLAGAKSKSAENRHGSEFNVGGEGMSFYIDYEKGLVTYLDGGWVYMAAITNGVFNTAEAWQPLEVQFPAKRFML